MLEINGEVAALKQDQFQVWNFQVLYQRVREISSEISSEISRVKQDIAEMEWNSNILILDVHKKTMGRLRIVIATSAKNLRGPTLHYVRGWEVTFNSAACQDSVVHIHYCSVRQVKLQETVPVCKV